MVSYSNLNLSDSSETDALTVNQRKIIEGAKKVLEAGSEYDLTMGYYVLNYLDGEQQEGAVYPGGDLDPSIGVCTDVVVRALREGNVIDLQQALHEDMLNNKSDYPLSIRGSAKIDRNIDHRRVMNLKVWFEENWVTADENSVEPGDIVIWDMNEDGRSDHTGIVSDKKVENRYMVIHSHPDPGYVAEEDKLHMWKITGVYRAKDE